MNILYINDFAASFPGSFFESLLALTKELNSKGHKVYFIFPLKRDYIRQLKNLGTVYYCPSFMGKKFDYTLLKLVCRICKKEKIDIMHTNFGLAGFITGSLISRLFACKLVVHERNPSTHYQQKNKSYFKKIKAGIFFTVIDLIGKNKYVAISSGVKESLEKYNRIHHQKIKIIPNAVLSERSNYIFDKDLYAKIKLITDNNKCIGMTAHFGPQKDHKTLVNTVKLVVKKVPNVVFLFIGGNLVNNKTNYRKQISEYIIEKKLEEYIYFVGEVPDPMPYIKLFDVGCLISNWEGFGNALVEYMLKKKPVIGTAVGGIKDIIDDGINGFLIPTQRPDILADKIIYLLENPKIARKMGVKGYKKALENYNMDNWVKIIIDVYKSLI